MSKPAESKPAIALNLTASQPPIEVVLNTVIIYQGPGSWKREAYWDEYIVTVTNRGPASCTLDSAQLSGLGPNASFSGSDPWALEKQSRTLAERGFDLGQNAVVQLGTGIGTVSLGIGLGALAGGSGWSAIGTAAVGGVVAIPVFVGTAIYRNVSSRHDVEREFTRRRLALPVTLVPGQTVQGSLFFPITPGPQRLALHSHAGAEPADSTIDLTPLAGLHLRATTAATP